MIKPGYFKGLELKLEQEDIKSIIEISPTMSNAAVDVKIYQKEATGEWKNKSWIMTEFRDYDNSIHFVDLYSYEKSMGFSSLAASILIEAYQTIIAPNVIQSTKCYGRLSSNGDSNPEKQHQKRVKFWRAFNFNVSPGAHKDEPPMESLLINLKCSDKARQVSNEFYHIANYT